MVVRKIANRSLRQVFWTSSLIFICIFIVFLIFYSIYCSSDALPTAEAALISDVKDNISLAVIFLVAAMTQFVTAAICIRRIIVFLDSLFEKILNDVVENCMDSYFCVACALYLISLLIMVWVQYDGEENKIHFNFIILTSSSAVVAVFSDLLLGFTDEEMNYSQEETHSIGALWAHGAYIAYYHPIMEDFAAMVKAFERKANAELFINKMIVIMPLSCDILGTFNDKDPNLIFKDYLFLECDQGANINRQYKVPIYYMQEQDVFIAAEFPSCLGTLFEERFILDPDIRRYQRDCFMASLKNLLKEGPFIVLEYHDEDAMNLETLSDFIWREIKPHSKKERKISYTKV